MKSCLDCLRPITGDTFSEDELEAFCRMQPGVTLFNKGDHLIQEKEMDRTIFLQLSGKTIVTKSSQPDMVLGELMPGFVFGEVTFFKQGKRTANITAAEDTTALMIDPYALNELSEDLQIKLLTFLLPRITIRLGFYNKLLVELLRLEKENVGIGYEGNPLGVIDPIEEDYFDIFSEDEARSIVGLQPGPIDIRSGEYLSREGDSDGTMFLLLDGELRLEKTEMPGLALYTMGAGHMVNFGVLFKDDVRYGNFMAIGEVSGLRIHISQYQQLPSSVRLIMLRRIYINVIDRLKNYNLALLKLEHMKKNIWFGG
ncbi:MAG: cyclic nucleotide-binding domain-containing protein [Magnetococcales bacterium]|nr:cyclic nucleotide-binding domain-containing protein [Magnetococcales bacterium]